jgi:Type I phosphodiesterase / nucleotide pyrophosphatase
MPTADPGGVVRPRYGGGSLADLMPSVLAVLGVPDATDLLGLRATLDGVRRVAVLLVDGLGHHLLPLAARTAPTLADVLAGRLGTLATITSGFPSTTPTSLASLGTGAAPGAHGLLGFTVNVPGTRRVLNHIEWAADPDPLRWQPLATQFERAAAAGVATTVVSRPSFAGSGLTVSAYRGAGYVPADDTGEMVARVSAALAGQTPRLVYAYHPDLDRTGHLFGVDSPQWQAAASDVDSLLTWLAESLPPDAALVVTADHGQLDVPPESRFDLDADRRLRAGVRVVAGEPRVRYLHTRPGATEDVIATWRAVLSGRARGAGGNGDAAWVASRAEAVAAGWFGPVPEAHLARVGDVVVVCHGRYAVLATKTEPPLVSALVAYHGSYTAAEMLVPLLVVRGGD